VWLYLAAATAAAAAGVKFYQSAQDKDANCVV